MGGTRQGAGTASGAGSGSRGRRRQTPPWPLLHHRRPLNSGRNGYNHVRQTGCKDRKHAEMCQPKALRCVTACLLLSDTNAGKEASKRELHAQQQESCSVTSVHTSPRRPRDWGCCGCRLSQRPKLAFKPPFPKAFEEFV